MKFTAPNSPVNSSPENSTYASNPHTTRFQETNINTGRKIQTLEVKEEIGHKTQYNSFSGLKNKLSFDPSNSNNDFIKSD
jgi:hypothetical protein